MATCPRRGRDKADFFSPSSLTTLLIFVAFRDAENSSSYLGYTLRVPVCLTHAFGRHPKRYRARYEFDMTRALAMAKLSARLSSRLRRPKSKTKRPVVFFRGAKCLAACRGTEKHTNA